MEGLVETILGGKKRLTEDEVRHLTGMAEDYFREKPNVVKIPSENMIFIGDLHGELTSAVPAQRYIEKYDSHHFVFLGDYVDRGPAQVETFNLVIALALAYPERVTRPRACSASRATASR